MPDQDPLIAKTLAEAEQLRDHFAQLAKDNEAIRFDLAGREESLAAREAAVKETSDQQRETATGQDARARELDTRLDEAKKAEKSAQAAKEEAALLMDEARAARSEANERADTILAQAESEALARRKTLDAAEAELVRRTKLLGEDVDRNDAREAQLEQREIDLSREKETYKERLKAEFLAKLK